MVTTIIEDDLKALIDATIWTVGVEGITKNTYVYHKSHSKTLDLDTPIVADTEVVFVIPSAVRSLVSRSMASKVYQFNGILRQTSKTYDQAKLSFHAMKTIADSVLDLLMFFPGPIGNPVDAIFYSAIMYQWNIFESD